MLFFKLGSGTEILIHDRANEEHCLWGIFNWLFDYPAADGLERIEFSQDFRLILRFDESVEYETAIRRASHAWQHYLLDYFDGRELAVVIGDQGLPLEVPDWSVFVDERATA